MEENVVGEYVEKIGMRRILIMLLGNVFLEWVSYLSSPVWVMMRIMP